ncbi:MAG: hypothetical protein AAF495_22690 [Pseudomonadota bacterium]
MIDPASLAAGAVGFAAAYLGKIAKRVADDSADLAAKKITAWIKGKLGEEEAVAELEAAPESEGARLMVQGALLARLEAEPGLAEELAALLEQAERAGATQKIAQSGDSNVGVQVTGNQNQINIARKD